MAKPRLLLIDDHSLFRSGLRMVLNASGIPLLHKPVSPGQLYRKMVEAVAGF